MYWRKFFLAFIPLLCLLVLLSVSLPMRDSSMPPLGSFLSPFTGFWQHAEGPWTFRDKEIVGAAVKEPIEIIMDERLVPHVFAANQEDLAYAQGYLHAKYRLFQMDLATRAISGRLSEIIGPRTLEIDRESRHRGYVFGAQNKLRSWQNTPEFKLVEAYSRGVNAYIENLKPKNYPLEFKLLNYDPEAWSPLKTALMVISMNKTLCMKESDVEASNALLRFGQETFDYLFPEWNPKQSPVVPSDQAGPVRRETPSRRDTASAIGYLPYRPLEIPETGIGSNNWAVSGAKTASGHPILCNDPHLDLSLPSIWFEGQYTTADNSSYGVSVPGIPFNLIGFNEYIAWGNTNVGQDVLDWYRITWANPEKSAYLVDGKAIPVEYRIDTICVKGGKDQIDTTRYTRWGPIAYSNPGDPHQDLAMHWLALDEAETSDLTAFFNLNRAHNLAEYEKAVRSYFSPAQNIIFASKEGDIALRVSGRLPLKRKEQGRFVQDGSRSDNAWQGFIPQTANPMIKNPPRGFVSSANQHSTSPDYPYYYNGSFDDYRGRILNRSLAEMGGIRVEDMMKLQQSTHSIEPEEALPALLMNLDQTGIDESWEARLAKLRRWNYNFEADMIEPVLFDLWYSKFYELTWDEMQSDSFPILLPEYWRTLAMLYEQPEDPFWDIRQTYKKEVAPDIVLLSFKQANNKLDSLLNKDKKYNWYKHRNSAINHLARIPAFSISEVMNGGYKNALSAMKEKSGPSWRMVVELGPETRAFGIYPGGQSGNPGSRFYRDMVARWQKGEYNSLLMTRDKERLKKGALQTFWIKPAN